MGSVCCRVLCHVAEKQVSKIATFIFTSIWKKKNFEKKEHGFENYSESSTFLHAAWNRKV